MNFAEIGLLKLREAGKEKMREKSKWWLRAVFTLCLIIIGVGTAQKIYGQNVPEEIIIDKGIYSTDIYGGVRFSHGAHVLDFGIVCGVCHHTWNQEENILPDKCTKCHQVKDTEKVSLRDAYMNNCRGCHGRLKVEGKPAGPTRCNECHRKNKRMR